MKAGKITAKLRDAVKVCFMVEGEEIKRYKNIEMPDALKELEIRDFHFNVLTDGKIEFWLHFEQGVLPEEWPECRERKHRGAKGDAVAMQMDEVKAPSMPEPVTEPMEAAESDTSEAESVDVIDAVELATEPVTAEEGTVFEADTPSEEPTKMAKVAAASAPEKKPAKRGEKPESRFKKVHMEDVAM